MSDSNKRGMFSYRLPLSVLHFHKPTNFGYVVSSLKSCTESNIYSVRTRRIHTATVNMESDGNQNTSKKDLKMCLTPIQYHVTQEKGTEHPFSGKYTESEEAGLYLCVVCKKKLFSSETKYDSGCGWPAFSDSINSGSIKLNKDTSQGMVRIEVTCEGCDAHLGHVFDDGPKPTGLRYCINSASLDFKPLNNQK